MRYSPKPKLHHLLPPYSDEVVVFANDRHMTAVPAWIHTTEGSSWQMVCAGEYYKSERGISGIRAESKPSMRNLVSRCYPGHDEVIDIFSDTSFHSDLCGGTAEKVTNYGINDYNLQYSAYTLVNTYDLLFPLKTNRGNVFGEEIDSVRTFVWHYIVLSWIPEEFIKLQVRYSQYYPDGSDKTIFSSDIYNLAEKDVVIDLFYRFLEDLAIQEPTVLA